MFPTLASNQNIKPAAAHQQTAPPAPHFCWGLCCWWMGRKCSRDSGRPASGQGCSLKKRGKSSDDELHHSNPTERVTIGSEPDLDLTPSLLQFLSRPQRSRLPWLSAERCGSRCSAEWRCCLPLV